MERFTATLDYVLKQTSFLPALLAFSLGPANSLRGWLAVQSLDAPTKVDEAQLRADKRRTRLRSLAFLVVFFTFEMTLLSSSLSEDLCDMIFRAIVGALFQTSCIVFLGDRLRAGRWVAYRRPMGMISWRIAPGSVSKPRVALAAILATLVNLGAYYTEYRTFSVLVSAALLYRFSSQGLAANVSIRGACILLLSWLALTFTLSGLVIFALAKSGIMDDDQLVATAPLKDGEVRIMMIDQQPQQPINVMSPMVERYVGLIMPFAFSAGPAFLLALCYRFDFSRHLALTGNSTPLLETIDAPTKRPHYTRGVLVPAVAPRGHAKPYFGAAFAGWFLAQALTTALYTFVDIPADILETQTYDLLVLTLAIPFMVGALVSTAVCRGEMKDLWRYTEKWSPTKQELKQLTEQAAAGSAAAEEEDVEGATDEILAYGDEKEAVPEYTPVPADIKA